MALNDITFAVGSGNLGTPLPNEDHISAMYFNKALPAAWGTTKAKSYTRIEDMQADGITEANATYGEVWYHAFEYFRINPNATLWLYFNATFLWEEFFTLTNGKVRQLGAYLLVDTDMGTTWKPISDNLLANHAPCVFVLGFTPAAPPTMATMVDLSTKACDNMVVIPYGSHLGRAAALATSLARPYIPAMGTCLGAVSKASVHENIGWVNKFNLSDGVEMERIRHWQGASDPTVSMLDAINTKRWLVLRKHVGIAGTYLNDSLTATLATSDYNRLERLRTIYKVRRNVRAVLLPYLNSAIDVDGATGKLDISSITFLETVASRPIEVMQSSGEVSAYKVLINPNQNVLATGILNIEVRIVPRGVANNIIVNLGYAVTVNP